MYSIWSRLRKRRIVISETSREKVIDIAYISPMGIVKTKVLIHEELWFPKICRLVEEKVKSFLARLVTTPRNGRKLLQMFKSPKASWTELIIDFGLVPTHCNEYLPVLVNEYSRFPIVELVRSTYSNAVIPCLDKIFSEYGIPEVVRSDNGHFTIVNSTSLRSIWVLFTEKLLLTGPLLTVKWRGSCVLWWKVRKRVTIHT